MMKNSFKTVLVFSGFFSIALLSSCSSGTSSNSDATLSFSVEPASNSTPTGTQNYISPAIKVSILDSNGTVESTANVPVTLSIANQPNVSQPMGEIYTGTLIGNVTVNSVNGIATFESLSVTQPGNGYTLVASAEGYKSAISTPFNVNSSIAIAESAGYKSTLDSSGYEVAYIGDIGSNYQGNVYVYIDYGSNPITTDEEFSNFNCGESWIRNTPRNATFDYANTLGSPMAASGPLTPYTDCQGHTWGLIVVNQSYNWPFESSAYPAPIPVDGWQAGQTSSYVPPGEIKYSNINKNQFYLFTKNNQAGEAILRHFITDTWGNIYIMKSTNFADTTPEEITRAFESAVLPIGFKKTSIYLTQDLYSMPAYNYYGNATYPSSLFMDFRDSADNAYSMIYWSGNGNSIPQQVQPTGILPLFTTEKGGRLNGTDTDDQMWGSFGNDVFYPYSGNDTIDGGLGENTVVFVLASSVYAISTSDGITTVSGPDGVKTLSNIQYLQFSDKSIKINNITANIAKLNR